METQVCNLKTMDEPGILEHTYTGSSVRKLTGLSPKYWPVS
jgi:hypothetical protein